MKSADVEVEAEACVAEHLVEVALSKVVVGDVAVGGAGGGVDVEVLLAAEVLDAEEVGSVGDDDEVVEVVGAGDLGEVVDLLLGVGGVGVEEDVVVGDALGEEVVAGYGSFGAAGVGVGAAAQGDDERGDLVL